MQCGVSFVDFVKMAACRDRALHVCNPLDEVNDFVAFWREKFERRG